MSETPETTDFGEDPSRLGRRIGLFGAVIVALGAMLGSGIYASWGPAIAHAGRYFLWALGGAALIASLNAWSTTALARLHPVAGGVYAYGSRWLGRPWGVAAGIAFVIGKTASAAAAALTFGAFVHMGNVRVGAAIAIVVALLIDLSGVQRTVKVLAVFVIVIIASLVPLLFNSEPRATAALHGVSITIIYGKTAAYSSMLIYRLSHPDVSVFTVLAAVAIFFVAFAGYARISTMGEEVRHPRRTIPRATVVGLATVTLLMFAVGTYVWDHSFEFLRPLALQQTSQLLLFLAQADASSSAAVALRIGAGVASVSVLLSLIVGLGRTVFAMSDGGDGWRPLARVHTNGVPRRAELVAAAAVLFVTLFGTLTFAYLLSGASILIYYGIAHLSALKLGRAAGGPPRWVPLAGTVGVVIIVAGLAIAEFGAK